MTKPAWNHAFDIAFSLVSQRQDASDVNPQAIRNAILGRLATLTDDELMEAVGAPFDTYEETETNQ